MTTPGATLPLQEEPSLPNPQKRKKRKKYTANLKRKMAATIKKAQDGTGLLVPKAPFKRLVQELVAKHTFGDEPLRVGADALAALQSMTETHLTDLFQKTQSVVERSGVKTAMPAHFQTAVEAAS